MLLTCVLLCRFIARGHVLYLSCDSSARNTNGMRNKDAVCRQ
jgi:hypothetical protein